MAEFLDYRFGEMEATNQAVGQRLNDFRSTLEGFKQTYLRLAGAWGGVASENAGQVAQGLDRFGNETAGIVHRFLNELVKHLHDSQATEKANTSLFSG